MKTPRRDFSLALASAFLLVLAFPKHNLYLLAWIGLVPLLIALERKSPGEAFTLSFVSGITFLMGIYYWINVVENFKLIDFLFLGMFLGSYFGLFGLTLNYISGRTRFSRLWLAPCLWVSIEYIRSLGGFLALPWPFLGYSQYLNLPIAQAAVFSGVYGVSFLIVMVNVAVTAIFFSHADRRQNSSSRSGSFVFFQLAVSGGMVAVWLLYGYYSMAWPSQVGSVRLAVIQGNIPQSLRWQPRSRERNLEKHIQLTRKAAEGSPLSLVIWPETAVHGSLAQNQNELQTFSALTREIGSPILLGSAEQPKFGKTESQGRKISNSAFLISRSGEIAGRYDKMRLLPFGEYLPLKKFPWPTRIASSWNAGEFDPGTRYQLLDLGDVKFAVTICWENIFPDLFRRFVRQGAQFAVNITNEAWFGDTAAPYQFLAMSVFRAVENRIAIARAANTGVSGFIDPFGRILGTVVDGDKDIFVTGYLAKNLPLSAERTFYTQYGDIFGLACVVISIMSVILSFRRSKSAHQLHSQLRNLHGTRQL